MYEWLIARRYFKSRRNTRAFSLMNTLTIFGVALGVFSMILVIAVMNGLETDVKEKLLKVTPHVFVTKVDESLFTDAESLAGEIRMIPHVDAVAPCFLSMGILSAGSGRTDSVVIKGIFPERESGVIDIESIMREGRFADLMIVPPVIDPDVPAPGRMIMGIVAASRLGLLPKEKVKLVFTSGEKPREASFVYLGSFETGFKDYDEDLVLVPFEDLKRLYDLPDALSSIQIKLDDLHRAGEVVQTLVSRLGADYDVQDWRSMHKNLFAAMSLEKKAMSVILFVLILVAASGIAGGVAILITNKRKEIGILKSMGAQNRSIQAIFLLEGLTIGICGIVFGGITGVLFCYLADRYKWIHVDIDLFGTLYVPFILHAGDLCIIASGAILICLIAALLPAWKAAQIDPIRAIRE